MVGMHALIVFGRDLFDGTTSSTVLLIILIEAVILVIDFIALIAVFLYKRVSRDRHGEGLLYSFEERGVAELKEIVLDTSQSRKIFNQGEHFDSRGLMVTAVYSDGSTEEVSDYTIDRPDLDIQGETAVTVRYHGMNAQYYIDVLNERTLSGIELSTNDVKYEFRVGEKFDYDGLGVTARFSDGSSERVHDFEVECPSTGVVGEYPVVVTYMGFEATYYISVL